MPGAADRNLVWQTAVVRAGPDGRGWLEFTVAGRCARCETGTGCGAALFARLFRRRTASLPLPLAVRFEPGEIVLVGIPAVRVVQAAALIYLAPLVAFLAGALGAHLGWPGNDAAAMVAALASAAGAILVVRALAPGLRSGVDDLEFQTVRQRIDGLESKRR